MMSKSILEQGFEAQAKSLRAFGYPDVTVDMVRDAHLRWMGDEEQPDIIGMFCVSAFEEHPQIFGEPPFATPPPHRT
jgi:hypothetical protein